MRAFRASVRIGTPRSLAAQQRLARDDNQTDRLLLVRAGGESGFPNATKESAAIGFDRGFGQTASSRPEKFILIIFRNTLSQPDRFIDNARTNFLVWVGHEQARSNMLLMAGALRALAIRATSVALLR